MYRYLEMGTTNWCYFALILDVLLVLLFPFYLDPYY